MINIALHEGGSREEAGIIGFDKKISACWAAFANGSMSHSLDFGDAYEKGNDSSHGVYFCRGFGRSGSRRRGGRQEVSHRDGSGM